MASPGNRHCANCIGTLSFPMAVSDYRVLQGVYTIPESCVNSCFLASWKATSPDWSSVSAG